MSAVVRLGILTLFPLIESFSSLEGVKYKELCGKTLDILISVLSTIPPMSMRKEPADCVDAFDNFVYSLLENNNFSIAMSEGEKAILALIGLAFSRGGPTSILKALDALFKVLENVETDRKIKVGPLLAQYSSLQTNHKVPHFTDESLSSFYVELFSLYQKRSNQLLAPAITTDGKFLYAMNNLGLFKFGTGLHNTVRGLLYKRNASIGSMKYLSIASVKDKLFVLSRPENHDNPESPNHDLVLTKLDNDLVEETSTILTKLSASKKIYVTSDNSLLYVILSNGELPQNVHQVSLNNRVQISKSQPDQEEDEEVPSDSENQSSSSGSNSSSEWESDEELSSEEFYDSPIIDIGLFSETKSEGNEATYQVYVYETEDISAPLKPVRNFDITNFNTENLISGIDDTFFCTGDYLVYHMSKYEVNGFLYAVNLKTLDHLEYPTKLNSHLTCYDKRNNLIWTYSLSNHAFHSRINPGYSSSESDHDIIPSNAFEELQTYTVLETITYIFNNLGILLRKHPYYHVSFFASKTSCSIKPADYLFSSSYLEGIDFLYKILSSSLRYIDDMKYRKSVVFVASMSLRLLKVFIQESLSKGETLPDNMIEELKSFLNTSLSTKQFSEHRDIEDGIVSLISVCFPIFYQTGDDQIKFLLECIKVESLLPAYKSLLHNLYQNLSTWPLLSSLLFTVDESPKIEKRKKDDKKKEDKEKPSDLIFRPLVIDFIKATVDYFNKQTNLLFEKNQEIEPYSHEANKFLLSVNRLVLSSNITKGTIKEYVLTVFTASSNILKESLKHWSTATSKAVESVLKSSILSVLLRPMVITLCRRSHSKDLSFVSSLIDAILDLISEIERFNRMSGYIKNSDTYSYFGRSKSSKESWFLIDIENLLVYLAGTICTTLVEGELPSEKEKQSRPWLDTKLLSGGFDNEINEHSEFLETFASNSSETSILYEYIKKQSTRRQILRPSAKVAIEATECVVMAAMFKHLGLVDNAIQLVTLLRGSADIPSDLHAKFSYVGQKVNGLTSSLIRLSEIYKDWQIAVKDKTDDPGVFESFQHDPHRLKELCEMKSVEFDLVDTNETIKKLIVKLQEEIKDIDKKKKKDIKYEVNINSYEHICQPVIERARFLLRMKPSNKSFHHPSADKANPFALHRTSSQSSLRSSTSGISSDSSQHPLSKSISQLPTTANDQAKALRRANEEQSSKDFSTRVKALRKWLSAYGSWKKWQDSALLSNQVKPEDIPHPPVQGILYFVKGSTTTIKELEKIIGIQTTRAKNRIDGFNYLKKLFSIATLPTSRHQLLGVIAKPLSGYHYLENLQTCGDQLSSDVSHSFGRLFSTIASFLKDSNLDPTSRLLSLSICSLSYQEYDIDLLSNEKLFSLLQKLMVETPKIIVFGEDVSEEVQKEHTETIKQQHETLRNCAWVAFRLLATQCIGWNLRNENILDKSSVRSLQEEIFDLMCSELRRISMSLTKYDVSKNEEVNTTTNEQCFELLSLLFLLGGNSRALARKESIENLLSILGTSSAPRSQRLVLRLCRRMLPYQFDIVNGKLIENFLEEIGNWTVEGKFSNRSEKSTIDQDKKKQKDSPGTTQYGVYIITLPQNSRKILDHMFPPSKSEAPLSVSNQQILINQSSNQSHRVVSDLDQYGASLVKTADEKECYEYARTLSENGFGVRVQTIGSNEAISTQNTKKSLDTSPFWIDGHVSQSLASEYISLMRLLLKPKCYQYETVKSVVVKNLKHIPKLLELLTQEDISMEAIKPLYSKVIAALSVLGGFQEIVRVGGKVVIKSGVVGEEGVSATVVSFNRTNKVDVILDSESEAKSVRSISIACVKPVPEIKVDAKLLENLTKEILVILFSTIDKEATIAKKNFWIFNDIQCRSLQTACILLENPESIRFAQKTSLSKSVSLLIQKAKQCKPTSHFSEIQKQIVSLGQQLWDSQTKPSPGEQAISMSGILPYAPFSSEARILPTAFDKGKQITCLFYGEEMRKVEYLGISSSHSISSNRGRAPNFGRAPRQTQLSEMNFNGNAIIPKIQGDYYFEVKVEKSEPHSIISCGFCKDGSSSWENGSYRYQANMMKTSFAISGRKSESYGEEFTMGSVVGCGWNQSEGIIFFTKDGIYLGPAFTNVYTNNERVVPCVGIGKSVCVSVNFGQEPFVFDLNMLNQEDIKEKRQQETEERRKKEEDEKNESIRMATEPIVAMGYDLKKAIRALEATGFSGAEAAVVWLLENGDIEDEPESTEPLFVEEPIASVEEQVVPDESAPPNERYDTSYSGKFIRSDIYTYYQIFDKIKRPKDLDDVKDALVEDWNNSAMPELKSWMEKDGFSAFEVSEYLQRITDAYKKGDEQAAKDIVSKLMGDARIPFKLPSIKAFSDAPSLKINTLQAGMELLVKDKKNQKDWMPQMDATLGKNGTIIAIDKKSNRILLEFYDAENAYVVQWWYQIQTLKASTRISEEPLTLSVAETHTHLSDHLFQLASIFARRIVVMMLSHTEIGTNDSLTVSDTLELSGNEYLSASKVIASTKLLYNPNRGGDREPSKKMNVIAKKLLSHLAYIKPNAEEYKQLINTLFDMIAEYYDKCLHFSREETCTGIFTLPNEKKNFEYDNARAVVLSFNKQTVIPPNGKIDFYSNNSNTPLVTYLSKDHFIPYVLPTNIFSVQFVTSITTTNNWNISLTPVTTDFSLARWLTEFVLEHSLGTFELYDRVFNSIVDLAYTLSAPGPLKESLFYLMSHFIQTLLQKSLSDPTLLNASLTRQLGKFKQELINLRNEENRGLHSKYFQVLLEMLIVAQLYESQASLASKSQTPPQVEKKSDVNVQTVISEESLDPEFLAAIALSLGNDPSEVSTPVSKKKKKSKNVPPPPKMKSKNDTPSWLLDMVECFQILDVITARKVSYEDQNNVLTHICKRIYHSPKQINSLDRYVLVEGLPVVPMERKSEVTTFIEDLLNDMTIQVAEQSTWLPVNDENQTKAYMIIELRNFTKIKEIESLGIEKKTYKLNESSAESFNLKFSPILKFNYKKKKRTKDLFTSETVNGSKFAEYLKALLLDDSKELTRAFKAALHEIFVEFSVDYNEKGIIDCEGLEKLQLFSTGDKLDQETYEHIQSNFETKTYDFICGTRDYGKAESFKPIPEKTSTSTGLTLNGFLSYYKQAAEEDPIACWNELILLGYDLHLTRDSFMCIEHVLDAMVMNELFNSSQTDEELMRYIEVLFSDSDFLSPLDMNVSDILPINPESHLAQQFPHLAKLSLPALRFRFEILRQFNLKVANILPMIDFSSGGILARKLSRSRSFFFHSIKMSFFYDVLDKTSDQLPQPTVTIERLKLAARLDSNIQESTTEKSILKNTAFGIAFDQLRHTDPRLYRQKKPGGTEPHFSLKIDFVGENVEGDGGPYRQFFTDISRELTKVLPLFIPCPNAQTKVGKNRDKYIVTPSCKSRLYIRMYKLLGHLMGMAIRTGVMLNIDFPSFFWKPLVGQEITLEDLKDIDHSFFGFMKYLEICDRQDLEGDTKSIFEKFQITLSDKSTILLKPHGDHIDVNFSNREEYIMLAKKARINEHFSQMRAIYEGITEVVPAALLKICTWQDLEWRICGKPHIDINLLKRHTQYAIVSPQAPHIKFFWKVLRSFSQEDRRAFVRFAWAQERLPADDQEFVRTQTRMLIKPFDGSTDNSFPKADTCFFNLMLPEYTTAEILKERLLFAIHTDADSMDADAPNNNEDDDSMADSLSRFGGHLYLQ